MPPSNSKATALLRRRIIGWYRREGRSFLWRTTTDPYTILLSEIMLQQTQAARVEEKLPAFLGKFPSFRSLADSGKPEVIRAWRGLGYNNRAVRLRELAMSVVNDYGGRLPDDPSRLEELPGIGRYTANAVACFAFRRRVPIVEVNVHRVFSRVFWRMKGASDRKDLATVWEKAKSILPRDAWTWNQSVIELGATVCTASRPGCIRCPVRSYCSSSHLAIENAARQRPRTIHRSKPEPAYAGVPRRLWRGRVVEALRGVGDGQSVHVDVLGKRIKPDFGVRDRQWLNGLVDRLADDGIVRTLRNKRGLRVSLSAE
jgi:A/G-specific adenine glycosylase